MELFCEQSKKFNCVNMFASVVALLSCQVSGKSSHTINWKRGRRERVQKAEQLINSPTSSFHTNYFIMEEHMNLMKPFQFPSLNYHRSQFMAHMTREMNNSTPWNRYLIWSPEIPYRQNHRKLGQNRSNDHEWRGGGNLFIVIRGRDTNPTLLLFLSTFSSHTPPLLPPSTYSS